MGNEISVIKSNVRLSPYKFYTDFLADTANAYREGSKSIAFKLFENGDDKIHDSVYRIDPIVIPLVLSLFEQLSKFHGTKIPFILFNNAATIDVIEFLYKSDFFFIAGNNKNPTFPKGRNILDFDDKFFGSFRGTVLRNEHRVRSYSLEDDGLKNALKVYQSEEQKRDFLISHYTYKVREHFQELLFDNYFTADLHNAYIDVLSELITNAVLHSKSNAYALMFVNRYRTKFSISDNGVGFEVSMKAKERTFYYEPGLLKSILTEANLLVNISPSILSNLYTIFDTLYFSSLKDRRGLFDLMINVVLHSQGYFRVHNDNSQIIISNRMMDELRDLARIREDIYNLHNSHQLNQVGEEQWQLNLSSLSGLIKKCFVDFFKKAIDKYSHDIQYSSLRFYQVKFRGVHIEVEIPNILSHDNI